MLTNNKSYKKNNLRDRQKVFTNGICFLYSAQERTLMEFKGKFHFALESVGISQYWNAKMNNVEIDKSISIPYGEFEITNQDIISIDGVFYQIDRIVYHDNKLPKYWTLQLSRSEFSYEDELGTI